MLYAKQPIEIHKGPTPNKSPIEFKDNSNILGRLKPTYFITKSSPQSRGKDRPTSARPSATIRGCVPPSLPADICKPRNGIPRRLSAADAKPLSCAPAAVEEDAGSNDPRKRAVGDGRE
jgi:hypothetical protein